MTARLAIIVVPVCSVKRDSRAGEETDPRHAGQIITAARAGFAVVGHVNRRAFVEGLEIAERSLVAFAAARTTRYQNSLIILERSDRLRGSIHKNMLAFFGNVRRK